MTYQITEFNQSTGQITVQYAQFPPIMIDLPIDASGNAPTGTDLQNYINGFIPTWLVERETLLQNGIANASAIQALVTPVVTPTPTLAQAQQSQIYVLQQDYAIANQSTFPWNGVNYSADQLAQNNLNATINYINRNNVLPPNFPGVWVSADGSIKTSIPDITTFDNLYAAFVAQGIANFNHLNTKISAVNAATTVAAVQAVTW